MIFELWWLKDGPAGPIVKEEAWRVFAIIQRHSNALNEPRAGMAMRLGSRSRIPPALETRGMCERPS